MKMLLSLWLDMNTKMRTRLLDTVATFA